MQNRAIDRVLKKIPYLSKRKFGFPEIGNRLDKKAFSPYVQEVKDAFCIYDDILNNYYDKDLDINMTSGNPMNYKTFPPILEQINKYLLSNNLYKYPYSEGDDRVRKVLLEYIERKGFINNDAYSYDDIDEKGLSINNLTLTVSTSHAFNIVLDIIAHKHDVILMTAPNYGLFSFKPERLDIDVELIPLKEENDYLIDPNDLENIIIKTNNELQEKYKDLFYTPKVVAFVNSNPNNPLGNVMGKNEYDLLLNVGSICKKYGLFIIDDLIYRDICFDSNNLSLPVATIPGLFRNTISLFGLSKSYGFASLRAGFIVADEVIIREVINRIFREMDAIPAIIGEALVGAFKKNDNEYNNYFIKLREMYESNFNLFKTLVDGINTCDIRYKDKIKEEITKYCYNYDIENGINGINIKTNPKAGFFVIIDFTSLKGKKYNGKLIETEEDLLYFFYKTIYLRFLIGKSFAWPNKNELVGRFTFAKNSNEIINCVVKIKEAICNLE